MNLIAKNIAVTLALITCVPKALCHPDRFSYLFVAALDKNGDNVIDRKEFVGFAEVGNGLQSTPFKDEMEIDKLFYDIMDRYGREKKGIDFNVLMWFMDAVEPGITNQQTRFANYIAHLIDLNNDGTINIFEMEHFYIKTLKTGFTRMDVLNTHVDIARNYFMHMFPSSHSEFEVNLLASFIGSCPLKNSLEKLFGYFQP